MPKIYLILTANVFHQATSIIIEFDTLLQCQLEADHFQSFFFFDTHDVRLNAVPWKSVGQSSKRKKTVT